MFVSHSLVHAAKANRRMPVHKPWEACFPRWIKSSLSLSALVNLTAFLSTRTFSFGRFPRFTWWRLVICQKSLHLHNRFKYIHTYIHNLYFDTIRIKAKGLWGLRSDGARRCARHHNIGREKTGEYINH